MATFEKVSLEELNRFVVQASWNIPDVLSMRGTEGVNPLIPRQLYEILSGFDSFYRWNTFEEAIIDKVGIDGVAKMAKSAHDEIGTKINSLHIWCLLAVPFGTSRGVLGNAGILKYSDNSDAMRTIVTFYKVLEQNFRTDGNLWTAFGGYKTQLLNDKMLGTLKNSLEPLTAKTKASFSRFNASGELLAFFGHFDCRLGVSDQGPYDLGDGRLMIVRDHFVNEYHYHWTDVCEELPYVYTLVFTVDKSKMKRWIINDLSTSYPSPADYQPFITHACVFKRDKWDSSVQKVPLGTLDKISEQFDTCVTKLYTKFERMCDLEKALCGAWTYSVGMLLPFALRAGIYEELCDKYGMWNNIPMVFKYFYQVNDIAVAALPKLLKGEGWVPLIP